MLFTEGVDSPACKDRIVIQVTKLILVVVAVAVVFVFVVAAAVVAAAVWQIQQPKACAGFAEVSSFDIEIMSLSSDGCIDCPCSLIYGAG